MTKLSHSLIKGFAFSKRTENKIIFLQHCLRIAGLQLTSTKQKHKVKLNLRRINEVS